MVIMNRALNTSKEDCFVTKCMSILAVVFTTMIVNKLTKVSTTHTSDPLRAASLRRSPDVMHGALVRITRTKWGLRCIDYLLSRRAQHHLPIWCPFFARYLPARSSEWCLRCATRHSPARCACQRITVADPTECVLRWVLWDKTGLKIGVLGVYLQHAGQCQSRNNFRIPHAYRCGVWDDCLN